MNISDEQITVEQLQLRVTKKKLLINVAPSMILIEGYWVAKDFKNLVKFCKKYGFRQDQFFNWPFVENMDGTPHYPKAKDIIH